MGGDGSTRRVRHSKRMTADQCLILAASSLKALLVLGPGHARLAAEIGPWGRHIEQLRFITDSFCDLAVRILYTIRINGHPHEMDYLVGVESWPAPYGGVRWFFECPLIATNHGCGRRASKLYLPPGGSKFACRQCYDLTYSSAQEEHRGDAIYAQISKDLGIGGGVKEVKAILRRERHGNGKCIGVKVRLYGDG